MHYGPLRLLLLTHTYLVGLINLWLFLFPISLSAAHPKEFFLDGLKKLEQRSHKCVELRGKMESKYIFFNLVVFFIKPKTYQPNRI
jgi:hypothetical protein